MRHSKLEPLSLELKVKLGVVLPGGARRAGVDGGVRGGQVDRPGVAGGCGVGVAGVSVARTSKVWLPWRECGRDRVGAGAGAPAAAVDAALEGGAGLEELKLKLGVVLLDGSAGFESMVVFGASVDDPGVARRARCRCCSRRRLRGRRRCGCPRSAQEMVSGLVQEFQLPLSMCGTGKVEPVSAI